MISLSGTARLPVGQLGHDKRSGHDRTTEKRTPSVSSGQLSAEPSRHALCVMARALFYSFARVR
jgi:hypothetical protein